MFIGIGQTVNAVVSSPMSSLSADNRQQQRLRREQRRGFNPTISRRNAMVLKHYGLAHLAAQRQLAKGTGSLDDLLQEASLGLIKAASGYEPSRGHRFSSYAMAMAQGQILHYRRDREPTLHQPWRLASLHAKGARLQQERSQKQQPLLSTRLLAEALGVTTQRWEEACTAHHQRRLISLHQPVHGNSTGPDDHGSCLLDQLADRKGEVGEDGARDWLLEALQQLPLRTRQWLIRRHVHGESVRQISLCTGLSRRAIRTELTRSEALLKQLASLRIVPMAHAAI